VQFDTTDAKSTIPHIDMSRLKHYTLRRGIALLIVLGIFSVLIYYAIQGSVAAIALVSFLGVAVIMVGLAEALGSSTEFAATYIDGDASLPGLCEGWICARYDVVEFKSPSSDIYLELPYARIANVAVEKDPSRKFMWRRNRIIKLTVQDEDGSTRIIRFSCHTADGDQAMRDIEQSLWSSRQRGKSLKQIWKESGRPAWQWEVENMVLQEGKHEGAVMVARKIRRMIRWRALLLAVVGGFGLWCLLDALSKGESVPPAWYFLFPVIALVAPELFGRLKRKLFAKLYGMVGFALFGLFFYYGLLASRANALSLFLVVAALVTAAIGLIHAGNVLQSYERSGQLSNLIMTKPKEKED